MIDINPNTTNRTAVIAADVADFLQWRSASDFDKTIGNDRSFIYEDMKYVCIVNISDIDGQSFTSLLETDGAKLNPKYKDLVALCNQRLDGLRTDLIVESVRAKFYERSQRGIRKYGTTMEENSCSLIEWLNHLQEELMDATLYVEKLKKEIEDK